MKSPGFRVRMLMPAEFRWWSIGAQVFRVFLIGLALGRPGSAQARGDQLTVAAWLPTTWDYRRAMESFRSGADTLSSISPIWYRLTAGGNPEARVEFSASGVDLEQAIREVREVCQRHGVKLIPLISNSVKGKGFDADVVSQVINSATRRAAHVRTLVSLVLDRNFDGIEIDYEMLHPTDRRPFSRFMVELSTALHAQGKLLAAAVHAKTSEPGADWGPRAHDYAVLGRAVDSLRIMTYDYHWSTGPAGPVAPLPWFRQVLDCATVHVPCAKLLMGLPAYGYDWTGSVTGKAVNVAPRDVPAMARAQEVTVQWDRASNSPFFTYRHGGMVHQVWYENADCLAEKCRAVWASGAAGVAIFRLGTEEGRFWDSLNRVRHP